MKEAKQDRDNIIRFPGSKDPANDLQPRPFSRRSTIWNRKSVWSMVAVIMLVTAFNSLLTLSSSDPIEGLSQAGSRSLASLGEPRMLRDDTLEKKWADKLAHLSVREIASVGKPPSFEDRLRFEYLEGKYAVRMAAGKIKEIEFSSEAGAPKYLNDRLEFIRSYRELLPVQFTQAKSVSREVMPRRITEVYQLLNENKNRAEIHFELDIYGRLLSMKVEPKLDSI